MNILRRKRRTPDASEPATPNSVRIAATRRLTKRYADNPVINQPRPHGAALDGTEALLAVTQGVVKAAGIMQLSGLPLPTGEDCVDALAQASQARQTIDICVLRCMIYARLAGQTWQDIGQALGYPTETAAASAERYHEQLTARYPSSGLPDGTRYQPTEETQ